MRSKARSNDRTSKNSSSNQRKEQTVSFGKRDKRESRPGPGGESMTSNTGSIFQKGIKMKGSRDSTESPRCRSGGSNTNNRKSSGTRAKDISTDKKFLSSVALQHKIDSISLKKGSWAAVNVTSGRNDDTA